MLAWTCAALFPSLMLAWTYALSPLTSTTHPTAASASTKQAIRSTTLTIKPATEAAAINGEHVASVGGCPKPGDDRLE